MGASESQPRSNFNLRHYPRVPIVLGREQKLILAFRRRRIIPSSARSGPPSGRRSKAGADAVSQGPNRHAAMYAGEADGHRVP